MCLKKLTVELNRENVICRDVYHFLDIKNYSISTYAFSNCLMLVIEVFKYDYLIYYLSVKRANFLFSLYIILIYLN